MTVIKVRYLIDDIIRMSPKLNRNTIKDLVSITRRPHQPLDFHPLSVFKHRRINALDAHPLPNDYLFAVAN